MFAVTNIVIIMSVSLNIILTVALCAQWCKSLQRRRRYRCSNCPSRPAPVFNQGPSLQIYDQPTPEDDGDDDDDDNNATVITMADVHTVTVEEEEEEKGERSKSAVPAVAAAVTKAGILKKK